MKLSLWGSQNQATYSLKERTLWNRWGSNMGMPIHILLLFSQKDRNAFEDIFQLFTFLQEGFNAFRGHQLFTFFPEGP